MHRAHAGTKVGEVRGVLGSRLTVELDPKMAGVTPIWEGRVHRVGQVGSLVVIPQGPIQIVGAVETLGIAEPGSDPAKVDDVVFGDRWLTVQLIGEIDGLVKIIAKCLAKDPDARFQSTREISTLVKEALARSARKPA